VRDSGISHTILRPNNFYENDLMARESILDHGIYPQTIGNVGLNRIDVRDIADAAANALLTPGHDARIYELHGPDVLTGESVAEVYSRHVGMEVRYIGDDLEAWSRQALTMMPEWMVHDARIMFGYFQMHGMLATPEELEEQREIIGHEPRRFEEFVAELTNVWKARRAAA
jgi:uncharacterized protein YbjT (DUF2867 family)